MVTPAQLMRPSIGRNASCALGDCLTSRPKGRLQPREFVVLDLLMHYPEQLQCGNIAFNTPYLSVSVCQVDFCWARTLFTSLLFDTMAAVFFQFAYIYVAAVFFQFAYIYVAAVFFQFAYIYVAAVFFQFAYIYVAAVFFQFAYITHICMFGANNFGNTSFLL